MIQQMLAIWSLVPLPFLKPAWTSGSSQFMYCWSLAWSFKHYFTSVWDKCSCAVVWTFFAFVRHWNENWSFPVLWPLLWVFQICWHIECSTFTASSFRIWNSWTGIPSPTLALFCSLVLYNSALCKRRSTSWHQDCREKYQLPQVCRWHQPYGRKWRRTKEPLDESEREA